MVDYCDVKVLDLRKLTSVRNVAQSNAMSVLRNGKKIRKEKESKKVIQGQKSLNPILNIRSGRFGLKKNKRAAEVDAICSKRLRDKKQYKLKSKSQAGDGKELPPLGEDFKVNEIQLSDCIFMFPNKKMSNHGNVFEGEIRSGVYGRRACVIKFAEISEQNVKEAKILSKLGSHTNVIAIVQSGTYSDALEDRFYIALDKCHEENLRQYLLNRKNAGIEFDLKQANDFAHQIIDGVAYIHDNKVVHLDLKPSNILLSLNTRLIKIADFGLSREIKSTWSKFHLESQFGTNGYRPIESLGNGWVSLRSDIFSLGAVLFYLLSNGEEVYGRDEHKYIYNLKNTVIDPSRLLVTNPKTTEHLIKLMLSNERCRRPTIWQVAEHPCWTGNEVECSFDYGCEEEIEDSDGQFLKSKTQGSDNSDIDMDRNREFIQAFRRMEKMRPPVRKPWIVVFGADFGHPFRFDVRTKTWNMLKFDHDDMNEGELGYSAVSCGDYLYVFTAYQTTHRLKYRDVTASWERMANLIDDHGHIPPAVVFSGWIILVGGSHYMYDIFAKSVTKYDPSLDRWEKLKDKQLSTSASATVASRGYVYCLGGGIPLTPEPDPDYVEITGRVERLDVASQSWVEVAPMLEVRHGASAVGLDGNIFVAGGRDRHLQERNSVEKYDMDVNQWTIVKPMITKNQYFRCHSIDGCIYAIGHNSTSLEKYDVEKDEWTVCLPNTFTIPLCVFQSVVVKMSN